MTTFPTGPIRYSQADVDAAFEPVKPLLIRMMANHTDPANIVAVLEVVKEELDDRHRERLVKLREYQQRAEIAERNRPTLHRILTGDAGQAAPSTSATPEPPASP